MPYSAFDRLSSCGFLKIAVQFWFDEYGAREEIVDYNVLLRIKNGVDLKQLGICVFVEGSLCS